MLREIKKVKQNKGERTRRWFTDDQWDLYLWLEDDGEYYGFQLCYAKGKAEHAFTWIRDQGSYHSKVDTRMPFAKNLSSPILVADGLFDNLTVGDLFATASTGIDLKVRDFVLKKIRSFENR